MDLSYQFPTNQGIRFQNAYPTSVPQSEYPQSWVNLETTNPILPQTSNRTHQQYQKNLQQLQYLPYLQYHQQPLLPGQNCYAPPIMKPCLQPAQPAQYTLHSQYQQNLSNTIPKDTSCHLEKRTAEKLINCKTVQTDLNKMLASSIECQLSGKIETMREVEISLEGIRKQIQQQHDDFVKLQAQQKVLEDRTNDNIHAITNHIKLIQEKEEQQQQQQRKVGKAPPQRKIALRRSKRKSRTHSGCNRTDL